MGRMAKPSSVPVPAIKKKSGGVPVKNKAPTKEEIIQRKKDAARLYSQISLARNRRSPIAPPPISVASSFVATRNGINDAPIATGRPSLAILRPPTSRPPLSAAKKMPSIDFKPMASSLLAIHQGPEISNSRRVSVMKMKKRNEAPRCSMLPYGINVFDKNTSEVDKAKVYEYMRNRSRRGESDSETDSNLNSAAATPASVSRARLVRFQPDAIQELRESGGDEIVQNVQIKTEVSILSDTIKAPQSILKKRRKRSVDARLAMRNEMDTLLMNTKRIKQEPADSVNTCSPPRETPRGRRSLSASGGRKPNTALETVVGHLRFHSSSSEGSPVPVEPELRSSSTKVVVKCEAVEQSLEDKENMTPEQFYMLVFNSGPIVSELSVSMLTDLRDLFQDQLDVAISQEANQTSLDDSNISLVECPRSKQKKRRSQAKHVPVGFRKYKKNEEKAEMMADQEVMLINDGRTPPRRPSLRLRQRNPLAAQMGGESPFVPLSMDAEFHSTRRQQVARSLFGSESDESVAH